MYDHPEFVDYAKSNNISFQTYFELYDIYGEDDNIWKDYLVKEDRVVSNEKKITNSGISLSNILEYAKNLDTNKVQEGITSIQKAISLFGDILIKDKTDNTNSYTPRPVYRRFDD